MRLISYTPCYSWCKEFMIRGVGCHQFHTNSGYFKKKTIEKPPNNTYKCHCGTIAFDINLDFQMARPKASLLLSIVLVVVMMNSQVMIFKILINLFSMTLYIFHPYDFTVPCFIYGDFIILIVYHHLIFRKSFKLKVKIVHFFWQIAHLSKQCYL